MKTLQEMPTDFDRMSTHEELHQVLDVLSESTGLAEVEPSRESNDKKALRVAVSDLWQNTVEEPDAMSDEFSAACSCMAARTELVN